MKRRDFFGKGGPGLMGMALAYLGLSACKKQDQAPAPASLPSTAAPLSAQGSAEEIGRKDLVKKLLLEKMGKTEQEATAMIVEFEQNLPLAEQMCICKTCPTYTAAETEEAFCHALVGQSKVIAQEKGCDCPKCSVYKTDGLKNGYYCTRKSEIEQEAAKVV
jgi:hypothetical protein